MSYRGEESKMLNNFMSLKLIYIVLQIKNKDGSFILKVIKEYFLGIPLMARNIVCLRNIQNL